MTRINSGVNSLPIENLEASTGNQAATKEAASQAAVQNEVAGQTTIPAELAPAPFTDPLTKNFVEEQLAAADKKKDKNTVSEELPKESLTLNFSKIATD